MWLPLRKVRRLCRSRKSFFFVSIPLLLLLLQLLFNASYNNPPPFQVNPREKVFIAADIVDGHLIRGPWGQSVRDLVDMIGKENVFVSVYGGPKDALHEFARSLDCEHNITAEEEAPVDLNSLPKVVLPTNGKEFVKRIAYLAEIRNRALAPMLDSTKYYDRVLFLNDVYFNAKDAMRLIWGTNNVGPNGEAVYKAACAADFMKTWKYYDTFATRDAEGYSIGVPLYPWFTGAGEAVSRRDVLDGKGAVRVKSCWGGMVALDGWYFQPQHHAARSEPATEPAPTVQATALTPPIKFRSAENETFWDASECCLIHADILAAPPSPQYAALTSFVSETTAPDKDNTGIFLNPYVRVSYSASVHKWAPVTQRFERLFTPIQILINHFAHLPRFNPRRLEIPGQTVTDRRWVRMNPLVDSPPPPANPALGDEENTWQGNGVRRSLQRRSNEKHTVVRPPSYWSDEGYWEDYERVSKPGEYCGVRQFTVMKEKKRGEGDDGGMWDKLIDEVPPLETS